MIKPKPKATAVILVNLGTPSVPTRKAVGKFLTRFLSDPRVVDAPRWFWPLLLRSVIVPLRSRKSLLAYQKIWWAEGSPLKVISVQQVETLQAELKNQFGEQAPTVVEACTYAAPSLPEQVGSLEANGIEHFIVIPLYPQYSGTTTGAVLDQLSKVMLVSQDISEFTPVKSFYERPDYIKALADSVRQHWQQHGRHQKLLMSFHGIPEEYVAKGDPYAEHCEQTAQTLAEALQLDGSQWAYSYQSRFGPKRWLQPYTEQTLRNWAADGIKKVDVISPAFTADCLETLEELNIVNREIFLSAGGESYEYISCLNNDKKFINVLANIVKERMI